MPMESNIILAFNFLNLLLYFLYINFSRYGLYGNPFEAELFDMEHSSVTKPQAALSGTTPGAIFTNGLKGSSNSSTGNSAGSKDQADLFDLLMSEKNFKTQVIIENFLLFFFFKPALSLGVDLLRPHI